MWVHDTNHWRNYFNPQWELICHNKLHLRASEISTPPETAVGTHFHNMESQKGININTNGSITLQGNCNVPFIASCNTSWIYQTKESMIMVEYVNFRDNYWNKTICLGENCIYWNNFDTTSSEPKQSVLRLYLQVFWG